MVKQNNSQASRIERFSIPAAYPDPLKEKIVKPEPIYIEKVKKYIPETEEAGAYHAATCLKTEAILITNDRDFQELKKKRSSVSGQSLRR